MHVLVFYAYINEIHGLISKISSKNLVSYRCAEGFNSGVEGLMEGVLQAVRKVCSPFLHSSREGVK
jgi:hypothetical protein